ncbi:MAG: tetratricopeptide repeat protein [Armatimonadetes bacterium]|nr:tetratricopeptide repeat protein [Armatimonadota bacterium]
MEPALPRLLDLWDFNDPAASEARFVEAEAQARTKGEEAYAWEAKTQVARALGLQRRFEEAHAALEEVRPHVDLSPKVKVRYLLERGRVLNSSGDPAAASPLFQEAFLVAQAAGEEFLGVDAAHMMGIVTSGEESVNWNLKALELARAAQDPAARNWRGSLLNNLGWTYHGQNRYDEALALFEEALAFRIEQGKPDPVRIAKWCVARCKRSLGRIEEALEEQRALSQEIAGQQDGYGQEEIAECLLALCRAEEAKPYFARAYELLSADPWLVANEQERLARMEGLSK